MNYKRPPITEALLEFRLKSLVDQPLIEEAGKRVKSDFFYDETEQNINISAGADNAAIAVEWQGKKYSSLDRTDVLIYRRGGYVCARLAPYDGWLSFRERAAAGWANFLKTAGRLEVDRIGLRYVNRIDIPMDPRGLMDTETYITVSPKGPDNLLPLAGYTLSILHHFGEDGCQATINTATIQSPLIGHIALGLDIDVHVEGNDVPRREDKLWELVDRMRVHKNSVFEACITPSARELFNS